MSMRFTEIGQQLRAYRLEFGLRAEEIAARLGVSRAALYRYEKGEVIKLDTIKRLAELLKISPLSLLGIGVEYYNRPVGYYERLRQTGGDSGPDPAIAWADLLPDDVRCLRRHAGRGIRRGSRAGGTERAAMRSMTEQVLGILKARKRMYGLRRPGIIAMVSIGAVQRMLEDGVAGGIALSDRVRRLCRQVAEAEVENIAALMETEPMGLQFGGLVGAEPTSAFKILRVARPRQPRGQPVPAGRTSQRAYRGRDDHRRRRGDCRASARGRDELARGGEGTRRRDAAAATDGADCPRIKRGAGRVKADALQRTLGAPVLRPYAQGRNLRRVPCLPPASPTYRPART